ncbi:MAG: hypothetical protein EXS13_02365 [Planctomycetes bacterium]|nr:hypothetical protein [Planctomycetota bacterium]
MSVRTCANLATNLATTWSALANAALAVFSLYGCAGSDTDANPFYVGRTHETGHGEAARVIAFGPFWDDERAPDYHETALHPLWRRVETPGEVRTQVLAPLFATRTTADESSSRFLALGFSRTHTTDGASSKPDYDFMLFPLLWFGTGSESRERYFALFPLGGVIKSFAGFAEVGFALFPLYYWAKKAVNESETLHSVTPLIGWADGGPRDGSWRLLPIAGRWHYEGKYDKWTFLWPFVHWQKNRLDTSDPSTNVAVWPLFGLEQSRRTFLLTLLWPFFRYRTESVESWDEQGALQETLYWHHDFLWPLWRNEHVRDYDYVRLFPFYSRYRSPEFDSDAWLIPLFWKRQTREVEFTKDTFDAVPLVHWERKRWNTAAGETPRADDDTFKLWPLFAAKHEGGTTDFRIPALLPLDIERFTDDFDASWGPFYELWHTRRDADGRTRGNALLRLVDWEHGDGRTRFSIPLLYSLDATPRRTTHSLLLGIVRFGFGEGGTELKLLGMPLVTPQVAAR